MREIETGPGTAQSAMEAHFGLGNATNPETPAHRMAFGDGAGIFERVGQEVSV